MNPVFKALLKKIKLKKCLPVNKQTLIYGTGALWTNEKKKMFESQLMS